MGISVKWYIFNLVLQDPGHGTRNARGISSGVFQLIQRCNKAWCHEMSQHRKYARGDPGDLTSICLLDILMFMSVLQSSTELTCARDI